MNIKEYSVKQYGKTFTVAAFDIDDVASNYPDAEIITLAGTHFFIGDGSETVQSLTKATPIASAFTGLIDTHSGSSHTTIPTNADMSVTKPSVIAFAGPNNCVAYMWKMDGYSTLYDQNVSIRFETAGTFILSLTAASDGGQADPQYMKITIT